MSIFRKRTAIVITASQTDRIRARFVQPDGTPAPAPTYLALDFDLGLPSLPCTFEASTGIVECRLAPSTPVPFGCHLRAIFPGFDQAVVDVVLKVAPDFATWQLVPAPNASPDIGNPRPTVLTPAATVFDPGTVALEQLARVRGSMWPMLDLSLGPRPLQATNIAATDFLWNYPPAERERLCSFLVNVKRHTHADVGPVVDSDGYHGNWSPNDWIARWGEWLDMHEYLWNHGLAPISFLKPDNWTFEQTRDALTPLLLQPRAQRLIRIAVPAGWEPTRYGWSNATWLLFFQWCREVLPNALCLVHTVSDTDALVGTDARGDDNGRLSNGASWCRVAPYLHGWLTQSSTFERRDGHDDPNHPTKTNLQNWIDLFDPRVPGSHKDRFRVGNPYGWPGGSAWGPSTPLKVYAAEYVSYWKFRLEAGGSEAAGESMGDAALAVGADGAFDGCTRPVGVGPVPWQVSR